MTLPHTDEHPATRDSIYSILKNIPSKILSEQSPMKTWKTLILRYAHFFRKERRHRETAELFELLAERALYPQKMSEYFYQSGLLFYKAGFKKNSVEVFKKAAEYSGDTHYGTLTQRHLEQIQSLRIEN